MEDKPKPTQLKTRVGVLREGHSVILRDYKVGQSLELACSRGAVRDTVIPAEAFDALVATYDLPKPLTRTNIINAVYQAASSAGLDYHAMRSLIDGSPHEPTPFLVRFVEIITGKPIVK